MRIPCRSTLAMIVLGVLGLAAASCSRVPSGSGQGETPKPRLTPLRERLPAAAGSALFERWAAPATGVDLEPKINATHPLRFLYVGGFMAGGTAVGDVDGDARPDLFFAVNDGENRLYRNLGDWRFEDISASAGIGGGAGAWGAGAAMVDIDGDRDLDLYVCNYDRANQLFVNETGGGGVRFVERAADFGLDIADACLMPHFCDYDRDGDLDVYIVCYRFYRPEGMPQEEVYEVVGGRPVLKLEYQKYFRLMQYEQGKLLTVSDGRRDYLMRNDGGRFTDVTESSGIYGTGFGLSASWWDYNSDGYPDLYVANDFESADRLYQNNHDGTFTDVIQSAIPHTAWYSMGSAAGDLDNDGREDLIVLDMAGTSHYREKLNMGEMSFVDQVVSKLSEPRQLMRNAAYLNTGTGRLLEVAFLAGIAKTDWSWAPVLGDFDGDGHLDLFVTNGMTRNFMDSDVRGSGGGGAPVGGTEWDAFAAQPADPQQNFAFRNRGGGAAFDEVSAAWGLDHVGISAGAASADLDGDGDLDLVAVNVDEPVSLFENRSSGGHRAVVRLLGRGGNSAAIGARVSVLAASGRQVRVLRPMSGFLGCHQADLHFGLGGAERIEQLTVEWPQGGAVVFDDLPVDHLITIEEGGGGTVAAPAAAPVAPLFHGGLVAGISLGAELAFDDFAHQPLLPNRCSQLGPGMAWGDVDGDGVEEVFVGGPAGQPGRLYRKNPDFSFSEIGTPFLADAESEDMAAVFFDCDGDGDRDLYVVSGSYEIPEGDPAQADRLYQNDGAGHFVKLPGAVPGDLRDCGSVVSACDFDRDGDLDLFVGSRLVPRRYPLAPDSRLLVNEGGKFTAADAALAPALAGLGLVTSAVWADLDGDGWSDLAVALEWGSVRVLRNVAGRLVERTEEAGLGGLSGWWNSLAAGDLDGDGDLDLVAGNVGLNTKYHASPEKPQQLHYGKFGGEAMRLVEAKFEAGAVLPVRGKSCTTRAMPFLKARFTTFDAFAKSDLGEIFGQGLAEAQHFEVRELRSGALLNDGAGVFRFEPLPHLAQISPIFGLVVTAVDGDGHPDLYVVQNSFAPQDETGRFDGGVSQLLTGDGDGRFSLVEPARSGLVVPGDAKALTQVDLDGDRRPDFVVAVKGLGVMAFAHAGSRRAEILQVRLEGPPGNRDALGARVTLRCADGSQQLAEVAAGGGYLSQSGPALYFGMGGGIEPTSIAVRWPDGTASEHPFEARWRSEGALIRQ